MTGSLQDASRGSCAIGTRASVLDCGGPPPLVPALRQLRPMLIKTAIVTLLLAFVAVCLFGYVLNNQSGIFREFQSALLSLQWMLLVCLAVWCGTFIFLTFGLKDLPLIGLLLIAIAAFFIGYALSLQPTDAVILLAGVTLGRGARFLLNEEGRMKNEECESILEIVNRKSAIVNFLVGLAGLLAFSSWWHLAATGSYHGPRWMGLWDNPNIYGMLMGAGVVLAIGLLTAKNAENAEKISNTPEPLSKPHSSRGDEAQTEDILEPPYVGCKENFNSFPRSFLRSLRSFAVIQCVFLFVAAGMMAVGLFFSYSRGAWLGTAVGLLYLAWAYGKFKWRFVLPGILVVAAVVCFFWHSTADTDQWYLKRLDVSRPSAQHRVSAWRGAVQMMWDHPLGVGWNNAIGVYGKDYSPPEGGAAALTMNSYLMLGTELGLPGLLCFVAYVGLCFRKSPRPLIPTFSPEGEKESVRSGEGEGLRAACLAGALVFVVAFWFDGGLFKLPTAAVFWILLELGAARKVERGRVDG